MKNKIIIVAAIVAMLTEAAAIVYMVQSRQQVVFGGEYLIVPLFMLGAYAVIEVIDAVGKKHKRPLVRGRRLTERTKSGRAVLSKEAFPEYSEETLRYELSSFYPFKSAVERLCRYEEVDDLLASRSHVCEANKWRRRTDNVQK